ncbi:ABC transporter permease [Metamycoplasma canadense]|nr:ABC transporter permease [Metamycoplasma canadense]
MQLKVYFRLWSSYITPFVIGGFYILLVACIKATVAWLGNKNLLDSNQYIEIAATFCEFASFVLCSFVTQTFFYRYKREGIEYILYSKPIKRSQIYFANVFASLIGSLFSVFILSINFFISQLIVPHDAQRAFYSALSFFGATILCSIFCVSLGALVHNFVSAKVFQVLVAVVPFLGSCVMGFVKTSQRTDVIQTSLKAANRPLILIPRNSIIEGKSNQALTNINKRYLTQDNWLVENKVLTDYLNNKEKLSFNPFAEEFNPKVKYSITEEVDKISKSFYSKMFWLNLREYFFPVYTAYDKSLQNISIAVDYNKKLSKEKYFKIFDDNGNLDKNTLQYFEKKYDLDLSKQILIKTVSKNKLTSNSKPQYDLLGLSYNLDEFKSIFDWSIYGEKSFFNFGLKDIQKINFDEFKKFNETTIEKIISDESYKNINKFIDKSDLSEEITGYNKKGEKVTQTVDAVVIFEIINILTQLTKYRLLEDRTQFNAIKDKILDKSKDEKNPDLKKTYLKLHSFIKEIPYFLLAKYSKSINKLIDESLKARFDESKLSDIQKSKLNAYINVQKTKLIELISSLVWTVNIFKLISETNENGEFKTIINVDNIIPYLSKGAKEFSNYGKGYLNNFVRLIKLNDNIIEFKRSNYIEMYIGIPSVILIGLVLICLGCIVFKRKNFN